MPCGGAGGEGEVVRKMILVENGRYSFEYVLRVTMILDSLELLDRTRIGRRAGRGEKKRT